MEKSKWDWLQEIRKGLPKRRILAREKRPPRGAFSDSKYAWKSLSDFPQSRFLKVSVFGVSFLVFWESFRLC